jgi:predicted nucleic acid-binding protein
MTTVVVDAKFSLAQALPLPYSPDVTRRMLLWQDELPSIRVPGLWEYEVVTGLRRACYLGMISLEQAQTCLDELLGMGLEVAPVTLALHRRALEWADRLGQSRAYDAQYLALAEHVSAELWTADKRLANGAAALGVDWVHWVGEAFA